MPYQTIKKTYVVLAYIHDAVRTRERQSGGLRPKAAKAAAASIQVVINSEAWVKSHVIEISPRGKSGFLLPSGFLQVIVFINLKTR